MPLSFACWPQRILPRHAHPLGSSSASAAIPILIGSGLIDSPELLTQHLPQRDVLLVSNTVVAPLYAARVKQSLPERRIVEAVLPDGEQYKTLDERGRVCSTC